MYHSFKPGKKWLDTEGKAIQAHGFFGFFTVKKMERITGMAKTRNIPRAAPSNTIWHWGCKSLFIERSV